MPLSKIQFVSGVTQEPYPRLDDFLLAQLRARTTSSPATLSKAGIRKLILEGGVYLNGSRVRIASKPIFPHSLIHLYHRPLAPSRPIKPIPSLRVIFEDADMIVVDKPPFLPTQPTLDQARQHLQAQVQAYLERQPGHLLRPYVGVHHRLDRDTSGLVLFTKTREINAGVAALFQKHTIRKTYLALAHAPDPRRFSPGDEFSIENRLGPISRHHNRQRHGAVLRGGLHARTDFRWLIVRGNWALVAAWPRSGRTHQIRAHLSESDHPILGDTHYGGPLVVSGLHLGRPLLHAAQLEFIHPRTQKPMRIQSPIPLDYLRATEHLLGHLTLDLWTLL